MSTIVTVLICESLFRGTDPGVSLTYIHVYSFIVLSYAYVKLMYFQMLIVAIQPGVLPDSLALLISIYCLIVCGQSEA